MQLRYIHKDKTLEELLVKINEYFSQKMKVIKIPLSVFEQYDVRPADRIFIPEIWKYRIVSHLGEYHFGKLQ